MQLSLCPTDHTISEWKHQLSKLRSNALFPTVLEGEYSPKGSVTPLRWNQETRVQISQRMTGPQGFLVWKHTYSNRP